MKVKVIADKRAKKSKGFGFVSLADPNDYLKAMKEMDGVYVGNRPIKLRKSTWKDRVDWDKARKMEKISKEKAKSSKEFTFILLRFYLKCKGIRY